MLVFFTGADCVPPLGFPPRPCLHFLGSDAMFPTASTCSLILRLPTCYSTYEAFKDAMIEGLTCNGGLDGGPRDGCAYLYPCTTIHGTFYMLLCNQLFTFGRCKYMHMYIYPHAPDLANQAGELHPKKVEGLSQNDCCYSNHR